MATKPSKIRVNQFTFHKSKSVYFSWSDDEGQLLLNVAINYVIIKASKTTVVRPDLAPYLLLLFSVQ